MKGYTCAILFCFIFFLSLANAQLPPPFLAMRPSLVGSLYQYIPNAPRPIPAVGYRVYLYRLTGGRRSQPSFTDSLGRYALYNVTSGRYLMRVFNRANAVVWQQEVTIPAQLPPIVVR